MFAIQHRARPTQYTHHLVCFAVVATVPQLACAQASPFDRGANSLVDSFTVLATPVAILAVMVLAIVAMTGRISWGWPIGVIVGIGVIFGAPEIVTWIQGLNLLRRHTIRYVHRWRADQRSAYL